MQQHVSNLQDQFGLKCIVSINHFLTIQRKVNQLISLCKNLKIDVVVSKHWENGGSGAIPLAQKVVELCDNEVSGLKFSYELDMPLLDK